MPKGDKLAGARQGLAALAGGLLSALLVLPADGASFLRLLPVGLATLPLFAIGFWAGPLTCFTAGLAATVVVTLAMGSLAGALYLGLATIPVALLTWQAVRRPAGDKGGILLLWLSGLAIAGVLALIAYFAVASGGLAKVIGKQADLAAPAAEMAARIAPGLAMAAWMGIVAASGAIAWWLLGQIGLADRPTIDIGRLSLPIWVGPILMVAGLAGAVLREGTIGMICLSSAIVLAVSFAFLGLALIHALLGKRVGGPVWVGAVYVVLLGSPALLGWRALLIFTLLLAGLGSADQLMDFRDLRGLRSGMRRK
jgi:hypothetical protein